MNFNFFKIYCIVTIQLICGIYHVNGQIWQTVTPNPEIFPYQPQVFDSIHLRGIFYKYFLYSDDAGATWNQVELGGMLNSSSFISSTHGWVSSDSGRIYRTRDGCQTWDTLMIPTNNYLLLQFVNDSDGFAFRNARDSFFVTNDGGTNWAWKATGLSANDGITFLDRNHGWSMIDNDSIFKITQDGGQSWSTVTLNTPKPYPKILFLDTLNGFVSGNSGYDSLLRTRDGGFTWEALSRLGTNMFCFKDTLNGMALSGAQLLLTNDGGINWTLQGQYQYSWCTTDGNRYLASGLGAAYSDDGTNWNVIAINTFPAFSTFFYIFKPPRMEFLDAATGVYLSGDEQTGMAFFTDYVYLTEDSGKSWEYIQDLWPSCTDIQLISDSLWYVAHYSGGSSLFSKSTDHLQTITIVDSNFYSPAFHFTDAMNGVAAGMYTTDGGVTWIPNGSSNYGHDYSFIDSLNGWTAGSRSVSRTYDGGITWTVLTTSIPPAPSSGDMVRIQFTDSLHGFFVQTPWAPSYIFYKTSDGGSNWQPVTTTFYFRSVYFKDSLNGWIAGDGIYYTPDGGNTFILQSDKGGELITFIDSVNAYCEAPGYFLKSNQYSVITSAKETVKTQSGFHAFPNPTEGRIKLLTSTPSHQFKVFDCMGRERLSGIIDGTEIDIDIRNLPAGIYLITVISESGAITKRIIRN